MELAALVYFAFNLNGTAHFIDNILDDGHAQARAFNFVHAGIVFALKRVENAFLERLGHTDAVVAHPEMRAHISIAPRRSLLRKGHADASAFWRKFERVGQQIQKHLVEAHAVAVNALGAYVVNVDIEGLTP